MKFNTRDLLWLTLLVAVIAGWFVDSQRRLFFHNRDRLYWHSNGQETRKLVISQHQEIKRLKALVGEPIVADCGN